jgi:hypothetical protein
MVINMSNEKKERRCKSCGKLLLDEKLPFCRRCVIEGRDTVGMVGGAVGVLAVTALNVVARVKSDSDRK